MKAHKYWSIGAIVTIVGTFYTGYKGLSLIHIQMCIRDRSAFSDDGLAVGAGLEDLGKGLRSQVGTMYATKAKGVRYLEMAEGCLLYTSRCV